MFWRGKQDKGNLILLQLFSFLENFEVQKAVSLVITMYLSFHLKKIWKLVVIQG